MKGFSLHIEIAKSFHMHLDQGLTMAYMDLYSVISIGHKLIIIIIIYFLLV